MKIKSHYEAAFILPLPNRKYLGDVGWEIESEARLPCDTVDFLTNVLNLIFVESYSGIDIYEGGGVRASVVKDDFGMIEQIHLKIYDGDRSDLSLLFGRSSLASYAELFFP